MKKVLALGAHYDDIEIGVGGTLLKHMLAGDKVFIAITSSDEHRTGDAINRRKEQIEALHLLKIPERNLFLFLCDQNNFDIVGILDKLQPDVLYTMFELDTHQAHKRSSYIGQAVSRKLSTQVVFYNSGTSYDFLPNIFSIISFEFKQKLLECFKSQIKLNAIDINIIQRRESYWASLISETPSYAEGFMIRKMIYEI